MACIPLISGIKHKLSTLQDEAKEAFGNFFFCDPKELISLQDQLDFYDNRQN